MTKQQDKIIGRIRQELDAKIKMNKEKYGAEIEIKMFEIEEMGVNEIKIVRFETNRAGGNIFTEVSGQLFIGKRGGLRGRVRTFGCDAKIQGAGDISKVTMWV